MWVFRTRCVRGLLLVLASWLATGAAAEDVLVVQTSAQRIDLIPHLECTREVQSNIQPEHYLTRPMTPVEGPSVSMGNVTGTYWFRVRLHNPTDTPSTRYVHFTNPRLSEAVCFVHNANGLKQAGLSGAAFPFDRRTTAFRDPVFEVVLPPGETSTVLVRVLHHGSLRFNAFLHTESSFRDAINRSSLTMGGFFGVLLLALAQSLLLGAFLRSPGFLANALFVAVLALWSAVDLGVAYQYLWPYAPWWNERAPTVLMSFTVATAFYLTCVALFTEKYTPRIHRLLRFLMVAVPVVGLFNLTDLLAVHEVVQGLSLMGLIAAVYAPLSRNVHHSIGANYFVVAWLAAGMGAALFALVNAGILPEIFFLEHALRIGFVVMLSFFTLALISRDNALQGRYQRSLERQVGERTAELQDALRALRPMCSSCKKIRDDAGYWNTLEKYITEHSDAQLSHSLCPECIQKLYPEFADEISSSQNSD